MAVVSRGGRAVRLAALVVATLMGCLVVFQALLAAGVPWGKVAYGGQSAELPVSLRVSSGVAAGVWTLLGLIVLRRAGVIRLSLVPTGWLRGVSWIIVALLAVSVVLNGITPSPWERAIWLPVSVLMLAGMLVVVRRS
jgi:hypothetical protein